MSDEQRLDMNETICGRCGGDPHPANVCPKRDDKVMTPEEFYNAVHGGWYTKCHDGYKTIYAALTASRERVKELEQRIESHNEGHKRSIEQIQQLQQQLEAAQSRAKAEESAAIDLDTQLTAATARADWLYQAVAKLLNIFGNPCVEVPNHYPDGEEGLLQRSIEVCEGLFKEQKKRADNEKWRADEAESNCVDWGERCDTLKAEVTELKRLLSLSQFAETEDFDTNERFCYFCGQTFSEGHVNNCAIKAALGGER